MITGFCFTSSKDRKETWRRGLYHINGGRNICLWNTGGFKIFFFFFFFFHKKEHSPWLHTQTSDLKITKFHFDCGGVKDRRQMHWLPANLDIHFFFPHPGSQQLQTRVQVRSSVARHTVSAFPSITNRSTPAMCAWDAHTLLGTPGRYENHHSPPNYPA